MVREEEWAENGQEVRMLEEVPFWNGRSPCVGGAFEMSHGGCHIG